MSSTAKFLSAVAVSLFLGLGLGLVGTATATTYAASQGAFNSPHNHWGTAWHFDCDKCLSILGLKRGPQPPPKAKPAKRVPEGPPKEAAK